MSANSGYTPGSMLRTLRTQSRIHADSVTRGVGRATDFSPALATKAVAFRDAPAPHVKMIEQAPPCQMT
eukprot:3768218-Prymnesium_polylepis.1